MRVRALASVLILAACASGPSVCKEDPITGGPRCQRTSGSPAEAVGTAAAAAAAWAVVGCTVNGCQPPLRCNGESKMCEHIPCTEGSQACPSPYVCDPKRLVCM